MIELLLHRIIIEWLPVATDRLPRNGVLCWEAKTIPLFPSYRNEFVSIEVKVRGLIFYYKLMSLVSTEMFHPNCSSLSSHFQLVDPLEHDEYGWIAPLTTVNEVMQSKPTRINQPIVPEQCYTCSALYKKRDEMGGETQP